MAHFQSGEIDAALDELNQAASINPRVAEIYNGGAIGGLQGDLDGSLAGLARRKPVAFLS